MPTFDGPIDSVSYRRRSGRPHTGAIRVDVPPSSIKMSTHRAFDVIGNLLPSEELDQFHSDAVVSRARYSKLRATRRREDTWRENLKRMELILMTTTATTITARVAIIACCTMTIYGEIYRQIYRYTRSKSCGDCPCRVDMSACVRLVMAGYL